MSSEDNGAPHDWADKPLSRDGRSWIGLHGPVREPICDPNGRAVYCVDECICAHCAEISEKFWRAQDKADTLYACVVVMFFMGLVLGTLGYVIGHGLL